MCNYFIAKNRIYFKLHLPPTLSFYFVWGNAKSKHKKINNPIKMPDLSLKNKEIKAKNSGIKSGKSMFMNELLSILDLSESVEENKPIRDMEEENFNTDKIPKNIRNLIRLEKDRNIKDRVLRNIRILSESDKEDYDKPIRTGNAFNSNYIEYESNGDKDKTLSVKEYLHETKPHLDNLIDNHKTQGECKIN